MPDPVADYFSIPNRLRIVARRLVGDSRKELMAIAKELDRISGFLEKRCFCPAR